MTDRRTIVRVMPLPSDEAAFYVNDWEQAEWQARFTVPLDHPLAKYLMPHREQHFLAVASTPEIEWFVQQTIGRTSPGSSESR